MAEAMYLGTWTVVTNWSANSEFVSEESACLVGGEFVELKSQIGPYEKEIVGWMLMLIRLRDYIRRLYDDRSFMTV